MIRKQTIGALVALALTAGFAQASVIYTFDGTSFTGRSAHVGFQLTVPTFINPPVNSATFFTCGQLDYSVTNCFGPLEFLNDPGVSLSAVFIFDAGEKNIPFFSPQDLLALQEYITQQVL